MHFNGLVLTDAFLFLWRWRKFRTIFYWQYKY